MSEGTTLEIRKSRPHGIAVREGYAAPLKDAKDYPYHVGSYECTCGTKYNIFVDVVHYDLGERFGKYVGLLLEDIHAHKAQHPDIINIPMEAEFIA